MDLNTASAGFVAEAIFRGSIGQTGPGFVRLGRLEAVPGALGGEATERDEVTRGGAEVREVGDDAVAELTVEFDGVEPDAGEFGCLLPPPQAESITAAAHSTTTANARRDIADLQHPSLRPTGLIQSRAIGPAPVGSEVTSGAVE